MQDEPPGPPDNGAPPPKLPETAEEYRAAAKWYADRAELYRRHYESCARSAANHLRQAEAIEGKRSPTPLRLVNTNGTLGPMDVDTQGQPESVRRGAARAKRDHPALRRVYEAGLSVTTLAKELREGRPRVSSWMAKGDAWRPIPPRHSKYLLKKYGIPEADWRRVDD